jgi:hypothetical protein
MVILNPYVAIGRGGLWMSRGRDGRRRRRGETERRARRRLPERGESGAPAAATGCWVALARRFVRGEGGTVHVTRPAIELLEKYGYDANVAIYGHFKRDGAEKGARSYLRVGGSPSEERIAVEYVPEHDAVVIWRWGEAEHDPDLSVIEGPDADA